MERLYSVGPVHLSLEGVLCHRREQRRRHRDREGGDVKQGGRGEMQIEGATAIVIFRSRRAERMEKNRAGVQGRHFLRVKTLGKRRRKKKEKRREREREKERRGYLSRVHAVLIRKMPDRRMMFRHEFVVTLRTPFLFQLV